jgi:hypothetical protein
MQNIAMASTLFISYAVTMIPSFLLGTFLLKEQVSKLIVITIGRAFILVASIIGRVEMKTPRTAPA